MNDMARRKLGEIVSRYGTSVCDEPRRVQGLLADLCPDLKRETHALVAALERGTAGELLRSSPAPWPATLGRLVRRLTDETAMSEEAARWAVESWAAALNVAPAAASAPDPNGVPDRPTTRRETPARKPPVAGLVLLGLVLSAAALMVGVMVWAPWRPAEGQPRVPPAPPGQPAPAAQADEPDISEPVAFDAEEALLPDECSWFATLNGPAARRAVQAAAPVRFLDLLEENRYTRNDLDIYPVLFMAVTTKKLSDIDRVTVITYKGRQGNGLNVLCTFSSPLDPDAVQKRWSEGIPLGGSPWWPDLKKRPIQGRDYWAGSANAPDALYLPSAADGKTPPLGRASQRVLAAGDDASLEALLRSEKRLLAGGAGPAADLDDGDVRAALAAAFLSRDALDGVKDALDKSGMADENKKVVGSILADVSYVFVRLNLKKGAGGKNSMLLTVSLAFPSSDAAGRAAQAVQASAPALREWWKNQGKALALASTSKDDPNREPREIVASLLDDAALTVTTRGSEVDVATKIGPSLQDVLGRLAACQQRARQEKDDEARKKIQRFTDAAKEYKRDHGDWPADLDAVMHPPSLLLRIEETDYDFYYAKEGLHNRRLQPDVWAASPTGRILANWSAARTDPGGEPAAFVVRVVDAEAKEEKCYALPGSAERVTKAAVEAALQRHTALHPESDTARILTTADEYDFAAAGHVKALEPSAEKNGYRVDVVRSGDNGDAPQK